MKGGVEHFKGLVFDGVERGRGRANPGESAKANAVTSHDITEYLTKADSKRNGRPRSTAILDSVRVLLSSDNNSKSKASEPLNDVASVTVQKAQGNVPGGLRVEVFDKDVSVGPDVFDRIKGGRLGTGTELERVYLNTTLSEHQKSFIRNNSCESTWSGPEQSGRDGFIHPNQPVSNIDRRRRSKSFHASEILFQHSITVSLPLHTTAQPKPNAIPPSPTSPPRPNPPKSKSVTPAQMP